MSHNGSESGISSGEYGALGGLFTTLSHSLSSSLVLTNTKATQDYGSGLVTWLVLSMTKNWKLATVVALASIFIFTYVMTSIKATLMVKYPSFFGNRPPTYPYWIPFIGNTLSYVIDGSGLSKRMVKKFGHSTPVGLRLCHVKMYLVTDAEQINTLFKPNTPGVYHSVAMEIINKVVLGVPKHIRQIYNNDDSGLLPKPLPGSHVLPYNRIKYMQMKTMHQYLTGSHSTEISNRYNKTMIRNDANTSVKTDWVYMPDLWRFVQDIVFAATIETMFGVHILSQNPTLAADYRALEKGVTKLLRGLPYPSAFAARSRMTASIKKWHTFAKQNGDYSKIGEDDPEWDEYFGAKVVKARLVYQNQVDGMDDEGQVSNDVGLMFGLSANATSAIFWTLFELISDQDLLSRTRGIFESNLLQEKRELDFHKAAKDPLLQSIFSEVLRLRTVGIVSKYAKDDVQIGNWILPKDALIGLPSHPPAMNPDVWNAGTPEDPHPLDKFWAERFLIYPNDPLSGPLRKDHIVTESHQKDQNGSASEADMTSANQPIFSLQGLTGSFLPFGGGAQHCPGRHFAKHQAVSTTGHFLLNYEIEIQKPSGWIPKSDESFFPTGVLPPAELVPFRIRQRTKT